MSVGVKEEEENHAEGHEIHVDQEKYSAMVEAPAALHAADCVCRAGDGGECGEDEERSGAIMREIREEDGYAQTCQHKKTAA
jgi:hypothetical protein